MPVLNSAADLADEVTSWRRDLHAHPEIGFEEERTSAIVAEKLKSFGIETHTGIAKTGVVGVLHGANGPGRMIGLRADMDALPMPDLKEVEWRSRNANRNHACGHDGHTSMLLGAAKHLAENPNFDGTVVFIFQPAEEGLGGGEAMVKDGLFDRWPCETVWGLHNFPGIPLGEFAVHPATVMAGVDYFDIRVHGQGCHGGMPHEGADTVLCAAQILVAIQSIVARNVPPWETVTISIPRFRGADAYHVSPEVAEIGGSIRYLDAAQRDRARDRLHALADSIATGFDCDAVVDYRPLYPPTVNHPAQSDFAATVAAQVVGEDKVRRGEPPCMAAEDFSYMLNERPGNYIWMGVDDDAHQVNLHHPMFDFNDAAIPHGISYWVKLVETALPR